MSNVVEMKRTVTAQVSRFGHNFKVVHRAGNSPTHSDPQVALYVDSQLLGYLAISAPLGDWSEIFFDRPESDDPLVTPAMVGMRPDTDDVADHRFLIEAEEYLLALLGDELSRVQGAAPPEAPEGLEVGPDPRNMPPWERAERVLEIWHNHGKDEKRLPELITIEIFDALEGMGMTLAEAVDAEEDVQRDQCGDLVRGLVEATLQAWQQDEEGEPE